MKPRTLVAGVGNIFLTDDGFGVEVINRLRGETLPEEVRLFDAGIKARHLAYELLDGGYGRAILIDAVKRGGVPGTVYMIEPDVTAPAPAVSLAADGHAMDAERMLAFVKALGRTPSHVLIVGCEPMCVDEGMGLSPEVAAAVDEAVSMVRGLICA